MKNWTPLWIIVGATAFFWCESHFGSPVWEFLGRYSPLGYLMLGVDFFVGNQRWEALIQALFHPEPRSGIGMGLAWSMGCTSDVGGAFCIPYLFAGFFARERRFLASTIASVLLTVFLTWVNSRDTYWMFPLFGVILAMPFLYLCFIAGVRFRRMWHHWHAHEKEPNQPREPMPLTRHGSP